MAGMITPLHYTLSLDPVLEERAFSGEVSIDLSLDSHHDRIVLDSSGLEIGSATIDGHPATVEIDEDRLAIIPASSLKGSRATVRVAFRGGLHRGRRGLFMSGACAVTQLQPAYARMVFPCFDDPRFKTTFDVSVTVSLSHTAVTNSPLLREEVAGDRRRLTFARSATMPVHLFGLAVGPFVTAVLDNGGVPIRLFSLPSNGSQRQPLLEVAHDMLHHCSDLLGVPYPWPKLDLVLVPEFEAAGIETTSVLYLRESAARLDSDADAERRTQRDRLLAHELAHQWFGSLVTPASWDDLWLSEGFATWLSAKAVVAAGNEASEVATVRSIRAAMATDSLASSRPLTTSGPNGELHELFDDITYWKGAAILRMLEAWLGEETFLRGIRAYLKRHAGGHATAADLFRALDDSATESVVSLVKSFVDFPGVPVLRFSWSGATIRIAQRAGERRTVPIRLKVGLASGVVESRQVLLHEPAVELTMPEDVNWVFGNAGAAGYYRCTHEVADAIPFDALSDAEALTRLYDAWDEVWRGGDVIAFLRIVKNMSGHPGIGRAAAEILSDLSTLLAEGARHDPFAQWIAGRFPAASIRGIESGAGTGELDTAGRSDDETLARFENLLADPATRLSAWNHLKTNWDDLHQRVVSFGGRGAIAALAAVADRPMRNDIARFFTGRGTPGMQRILRQTLERIDSRIRFRDREQLTFDAWLTHETSTSFAADDRLRRGHALINMLAAGFHGAMVHRAWLDGLRTTVPEWMQPRDALARIVGALERRLTAVFAGVLMLDEPLFALPIRLQEDFLASAHLSVRLLAGGPQSDPEAVRALAAVLARQGAVFERLLRGAIAFTDLSGDAGAARLLRTRLVSTEDDRIRVGHLLDRVAAGDLTDAVRRALWIECAALPSLQQSQAADLATLVARTAENQPRQTQRDS